MTVIKEFHLPSDLPIPNDFVLGGSQFGQRERPAAMQLLRTHAHFGAEAEFSSVGKTCGGIPVHCGGIDLTEKAPRVLLVISNDGLGMLCRITVDVRDGFVHSRDDPDCYAQSQIFFSPIGKSSQRSHSFLLPAEECFHRRELPRRFRSVFLRFWGYILRRCVHVPAASPPSCIPTAAGSWH